MTSIFVIHPDWDELSKISHILAGREFTIHKFNDGETAISALEKYSPDVCLLNFENFFDNDMQFKEILDERVSECPLILLVNKQQISQAIEFVGSSEIEDYFLMNPIVDPARLHVIIDKALLNSAIQLNLKGLKQRLSSIPRDIPESMGNYTRGLSGEIGKVLGNFKEKMKSHEFKQIVKLLDEEAFDEKLHEMQRNEISEVLKNSETKIKEKISEKLTNVAANIEVHLDNIPDIKDLAEDRSKLSSGFYFDSNELIDEPPKEILHDLKHSDFKEREASGQAQVKQILVMHDSENPTPELTDLIEELGFEVLEAHSRRKFLHMAKNRDFDLLIIGYNTGEIDGIEIIRDIRERLNLDVPAILLSILTNTDIIGRAKEVGIGKIVKLPFQKDSIKKVIKDSIRSRAEALVS